MDPNAHGQGARPSLRMFIPKELNAVGCEGLACETIKQTDRDHSLNSLNPLNTLYTWNLSGLLTLWMIHTLILAIIVL